MLTDKEFNNILESLSQHMSKEIRKLADDITTAVFMIYDHFTKKESEELYKQLNKTCEKKRNENKDKDTKIPDNYNFTIDQIKLHGYTIDCSVIFKTIPFTGVDAAYRAIENKIVIKVGAELFVRPEEKSLDYYKWREKLYEEIREAVHHEVFHSIDIKITNPKLTYKWIKKPYLLQPAEEDAFLASVIGDLNELIYIYWQPTIRETWDRILEAEKNSEDPLSSKKIMTWWIKKSKELAKEYNNTKIYKRRIHKLWKVFEDEYNETEPNEDAED